MIFSAEDATILVNCSQPSFPTQNSFKFLNVIKKYVPEGCINKQILKKWYLLNERQRF